MKRRNFLGAVTAAAAVGGLTGHPSDSPGSPADTPERPKETKRGDMRYRQLGTTKEEVSIIGLGGHHIGKQKDEKESIKIIRSAIDAGITFMDNSWDYHDGGSEIRMGKALQDGYRKKVFLMTKIDGRTKKSAAEQINESLKRLQTDVIDLMQHHEIIRMEDADRIFAEGGAMEAVVAAQKAGKIRYIGFTGHKDPLVHLRMLEVASAHKFHLDTAQMPLNVLDAHFRSFAKAAVPELLKAGVGILGMKPLASGAALKSQTVTAPECLRYALSLPTSTVITGIDSMKILEQALEVAKTFEPLTEKEMSSLLARTEKAAANGRYERFKTSIEFDATAKNPHWLGEPEDNEP